MQQLIHEIIELLRSKPPEFFQFKKIRGLTTGFFKGDHIELDYRKDIIQTIIHESIHVLYPKLSETAVIKKEKEVLKEISNYDAALMLEVVAKKIKHTEKYQSYLKRS
jgi:hypothetical protein